MWMLARFLTYWQDQVRSLRVLTQFCAAGMDQAKTYADFLVSWMKARHGVRKCIHCVQETSRFASKFWVQLELARSIAEDVRTKCTDFKLWDKEGDVLKWALLFVADRTKQHTDNKVARADSGDAREHTKTMASFLHWLGG